MSEIKTAGLVDGDGNCVNAILVKVDEAGEVADYVPPEGLSLILSDDAGVGRKWNGSAFIDPGEE